MSEPGEAQDAFASRAKPRPEGRVRERGWRATLNSGIGVFIARSAHRRAHRRAIVSGRHVGAGCAQFVEEAAMSDPT